MNLEKLLRKEKATVVKEWFLLVLDTYPSQTANMLKREKNQFANPVGHALQYGLDGIYDELLGEMNLEKLTEYLDRIIRIRAIQDFAPSKAVVFIFYVKGLVKQTLARLEKELAGDPVSADDLTTFETKVDKLALLAFDIYSKCRENLYEVRLNEVKSRSFRLLQRANLLGEMNAPGLESDVEKH